MTSSLYVIRGRPGRWEGVALDSPLAIVGSSRDQVRSCLADIAPSLARRAGADPANRLFVARAWRGVRRLSMLSAHFLRSAGRWSGLTPAARESHLLRLSA